MLKRVFMLMLFVMLVMMLTTPSAAKAQKAKVVELTPAEAAEAKHLREEQAKIAEKIAALDERIRLKYLRRDDKSAHSGFVYYAEGWDLGLFDYSEDYRFIVPAVVGWASTYSPTPYCSSNSCFICPVSLPVYATGKVKPQ